MNTSFMYHAFSIRSYTRFATQYEDNAIIFKLQTPRKQQRCSFCKSRKIILLGRYKRRVRTIPIGTKKVYLELHLHRLQCKECGRIGLEHVSIVQGKRSYTRKFERYVLALSKAMTIKAISSLLGVSWDTVKDIQKRYLYRHYNNPDISQVRHIGIDEFAVAKGHIYKTIVVDLETGRVIYIGDGKGGDALNGFWKKVTKAGIRIEAVPTDLSPAFISAVMSNLPKATLVFDHFHVVKLMNDALDEIRRGIYKEEKDLNKRKVIKGTRWLLLCNGKDIFDNKHKSRLDNALQMNQPMMKAYYLKESLREIWTQINKEQATEVVDKWIEQAYQAKIPKLTTMANTFKAHKWWILAWYDYHISTAKLEGINNKIKTMTKKSLWIQRPEVF